jgi:ribosome maturation protein SDO1
MVSVEKAVIAKISRAGLKFELLVDPVKAMDMKIGKEVPLDDLLASRDIFEDSNKGLRASSANVGKAFGTTDIGKITNIIIKEGDVQITTDQRRAMLEEKTKAIASLISKRGVNPQTGIPHPADRVLRAMEQAKAHVELEKRIEDQIEGILEKIQPIIPIKFETMQIAIKIPVSFAGKASSLVRSLGKLIREEWASDGGYVCMLEIPSGIQQEIYTRLNDMTHGQVEIKVVKKI